MAGFDNNVMFASNVDFRGVEPVVGQVTANGQLLIGSGVAPFLRAATLIQGTNITITNGAGTIQLDVASGAGLSLGAFGSTPNADGLSLSTGILNMQPADGTNPGGVSTTSQNFAGAKVFNTSAASASFLSISGGGGIATIQYPSSATSFNFNLPTTAGTSGYFLTSGGGGSTNMTWTQNTFLNSISLTGDTGGALTGNSFTFTARPSAGNSPTFSGSGTTMSLNVNDSNHNIALGTASGGTTGSFGGSENVAIGYQSFGNVAGGASAPSGSNNVCVGSAAGQNISSGSGNTFVGEISGTSVTTGSSNLCLGVGSNPDANVSSTICLNYSTATPITSNTLVIGSGTGTGTQQLNKAFISGINGVTSSNPLMVTINSATDQLGVAAVPTTSISLTGDTGGALTGSSFTIYSNTASQNSGSSVSISGSSSTLTLNLSDSNNNTIIGHGSGNASISGTDNVGLGAPSTLVALTSGIRNVAIGAASAFQLQGGSNNTCVGFESGANLTGSEGSNILIGYLASGNTSTSNMLQIGNGTGTSAGNLSSAFISGINGVTSSNPAIVTTNTSTDQMGTIPFVPPTTFSPTITFGGGSTGITYATQFGKYSRIGNTVYFTVNITLSNKGSSTGNAKIEGLPITVFNDSNGAGGQNLVLGNVTATGATYFYAAAIAATTTVLLFSSIAASGTNSILTDTAFANNTVIQMTGIYFTA